MNALVPANASYAVSDIERMAKAFAASKLFGVQSVEQALALCLVAQAEGRHPATAAQDYHIISGRPAKKADAMLRDFIGNGGKVEWHALTDEQADATFSHPYGGTIRIDWTMERAKAAGINNPMWKKYPRQMLRSRVVSEGVRTVCPGATSGMYVPEEVEDIAREQPTVTSVETLPNEPRKRKSSAQAKRDGDDAKIKADINGCDLNGLQDWHRHFDEWTAELPFSWLDSIRDMLEHRLEDINAEGRVALAEDELNDRFRATVEVRRERAASVAEDDGHVEAH